MLECVVRALHLTRHCGKHQLIRFSLSSRVVLKNVFSEKSGDNVMKKCLFSISLFVPQHITSSFLRSNLLSYEAILSRSAIQMNHRRKKLQTPPLPSAIYAWKRRGFHTRLASFFFFFFFNPSHFTS